jgi:EAL domain-containing protein (putative c-di-GMP-specific phosphodiesterase class I)
MEIAESSVTDVAAMGEARHAFRSLAIQFAYDDFGAGQARLNELIEVPPDYLKLDKTLVQGLDVSSARREMVSALVNVAKGLGVLTVAEGIETEAVAAVCRELGCDCGQGYFFGVPT